ncbi:MAG: hypothetical protein HYR60_15850 [Acidobacteria bacterium]|nr:hypothetical protein [Acidobacteriota bacterium]
MTRILLLLAASAAAVHAQSPCTFTATATPASFTFSGGLGAVTVAASAPDCAWTATSTVNWISVAPGQSGLGDGSFGFAVVTNPVSATRTGALTVGGQSVSITQTGQTCNFALSSNSLSVSASAQSGSFILTGALTCQWTAASNASWITLTSAASGLSGGTITFSIAANTAKTSRTGTLSAGGLTFSVTQAGTCTFTLNPNAAFFPIAGGNGSFEVASQAGCGWSSAASAGWISISFGQSGTANGSVGYTVQPNTGDARTATITVGTSTVTITQSGLPCTLSLSPSFQYFTTDGGAATVQVTTPPACSWTAITSARWIAITSSPTGQGNGSFAFTVAKNTAPDSRSDSILVGDQVFVATQAGVSCKYSIAPASKDFAKSGGSGLVTLTATQGCAWTVTASAAWITLTTPSSGTGSAAIGFSVGPNPDATPRSAPLAIADQTFTVNQAAGACTVSLGTSSANVAASGAAGQVNFTSVCAWAAASKAPWIKLASAATGTGDGSVGYTVTENTSAKPRNGSLAVGNQTFSILQAGAPCNYALSSSGTGVPAAGGRGVFQVASASGCSWTPVSDSAWIAFTWSSVNGRGNVSYAIEPNLGATPRSGTLAVAGQVFTVNQEAPRIQLTSGAVVHGANYTAGVVSPGLIVVIYAPGVGPQDVALAQLSADRRFITTSLAGARVLFDGVAAPMIFAGDGVLGCVVPYAVAGKNTTMAQVEYRGEGSNAVALNVAEAAPGLFTADASGSGQGTIFNQNGTVNSASNPAARNSFVVLYATGEGQTIGPGVDGKLAVVPLPKPMLPVTVEIDGIDAEVTYAGAAPGLVAGLMQVNARVPPGVTPARDAAVVLRVGQFSSRSGVTLRIQ